MPFHTRSQAARRAATWLKTPAGGVAVLVLATFFARILLASALGLGVDESYMVAAGRKLQLSYFDHPPIAWWLAWAAAHLSGNESALAVRLPFIALFALTTVLLYRVTATLFSAEAGWWAAVLLNIAPVFGISSGSWVLPDGPLLAALLAAVLCLIHALRSEHRPAWVWWLGAGLCAGLALDAKYSAALTILGATAFLLTEPRSCRWLARPHPYVAGLIALALFLPVLIWNDEHEWVSLLFQGGRASGSFRPLGPIVTLAGEAAFLLPWVWVPLVGCGLIALRRGPPSLTLPSPGYESDAGSGRTSPAVHSLSRPGTRGREAWGHWLLLCLAAPPLILFTIAALWGNVLFHWASPGYLMLLPLLGDAVARHWRASRAVRVWLVSSAAFVVLGTGLLATDVRFNWLPVVTGDFLSHKDPVVDLVDWTSLRQNLATLGLLDKPGLVVAAMRWSDAGKLDYALGGKPPVICLGPDCRQYSLTARHDDYAGADVLIVTRTSPEKIIGQYWFMFDRIEEIAAADVLHAGRPALRLNFLLGHRLHKAADECCAS
jgi:4-amino-4-deoxy-L-arabinose transferase-like glycosyltransferase